MFAGLILAFAVRAQSEERGVTFYTGFQGSASELGVFTRLDPNAGYKFNRFLSVDAGLPFYFIRPSGGSDLASVGSSRNGIGNFYTNLRLSLLNPGINYISIVTLTAPTGDRDKGLSTGKPTYDWNNYFDKPLGPWTPFVNAGVANAISDTPFFDPALPAPRNGEPP